MVYRQGIKNRKVSVNPAREVEKRTENNARDRYLLPAEETVLRQVVANSCPERMPELDIALHTACGAANSTIVSGLGSILIAAFLQSRAASTERSDEYILTMRLLAHCNCSGGFLKVRMEQADSFKPSTKARFSATTN